ncbi:MAG: trypsin-like serine protease [Byssovorax sp.]
MKLASFHRAWFALLSTSLSAGCALGEAPTPSEDGDVGSAEEAISQGKYADTVHDPLARAVVKVYGSGNCTGTLITPYHVLTAAHCYQSGAFQSPPDGTCVMEDARTGQIVGTAGCGGVQVVNDKGQPSGPVIAVRKVALNTLAQGGNVWPGEIGNDMAILRLASRIARTPVRPWLEGAPSDPGPGYWGQAPMRYYGFGITNSLATCDDVYALRASGGTPAFELRFEDQKRLDLDYPVDSFNVYAAEPSFIAYWNVANAAGAPLFGDSGGPLFMNEPGTGTTRVVGDLSALDCGGNTLREAWSRTIGHLNSLAIDKYARVTDPLTKQRRWFGDNLPCDPVTTNGCSCNWSVDPDCDGVPSGTMPGVLPEEMDNCPLTYNPGQENTNGGSKGDACMYDFALPSTVTSEGVTTTSIKFGWNLSDADWFQLEIQWAGGYWAVGPKFGRESAWMTVTLSDLVAYQDVVYHVCAGRGPNAGCTPDATAHTYSPSQNGSGGSTGVNPCPAGFMYCGAVCKKSCQQLIQ